MGIYEMPIFVTLTDGEKREFHCGVTAQEVAVAIGSGLAKAAFAAKVDGKPVDMSFSITENATLEFITERSPDALPIVRRSTAYVLAHAVRRLYPGARIVSGAVTENGFYYDFAYARPLGSDDLVHIEKEMHRIVGESLPIQCVTESRAGSIDYFSNLGQEYKVALIREMPEESDVCLYSQGEFIDLCDGPHVPNSSKLAHFKLVSVAGAYWRGDSRNTMLSRIHGTAWLTHRDLSQHLQMLEDAERRDHRRLGRELDLFHMQDEAPGMVFWHPNGWTIWQVMERYVRRVYRDSGYLEVRGPLMMDISLWERSGHLENYMENMFLTESEKRTYAIKPMSCPGHVEIFKAGIRSYRELPIRYAEFGHCHRNEPSGALHGLMRVRAFTQDDSHVFCRPDQIEDEVRAFHVQATKVYEDFGFEELAVKVALRPEKRIGDDRVWDVAEGALRQALRFAGVAWEELPGEGAFYGPKIEYHLKDSMGRAWQVGTMQVDFMMPERLGAQYVNEMSERVFPVMLHRAILGSMERFIGIVLEHCAGRLPVWLAPIQVEVLNVTGAQEDYAKGMASRLQKLGVRAEADTRNETLNQKIRKHSVLKTPYIVVVGEREAQSGTGAVRTGTGENVGQMTVDEISQNIRDGSPRWD